MCVRLRPFPHTRPLIGPDPPTQIYPDEGHFLHSEGTRRHLSQTLVNFYEECFRLPDMPSEDDEEEDEDED